MRGSHLAPDLVFSLVAWRKVLVKASMEPLTTTLASFLVCDKSHRVRALRFETGLCSSKQGT